MRDRSRERPAADRLVDGEAAPRGHVDPRRPRSPCGSANGASARGAPRITSTTVHGITCRTSRARTGTVSAYAASPRAPRWGRFPKVADTRHPAVGRGAHPATAVKSAEVKRAHHPSGNAPAKLRGGYYVFLYC